MKTRMISSIAVTVLLLVAQASLPVAVSAQVPGIINYQGRVAVGGTNFNGTGQFKLALVNAAGTTTYWSNGNTAVSLTVTKGLYSVLLGDTTIANMSFAIPATVFSNSDVRLHVTFNDGVTGFQLLTPDQRLAAVGYAMVAASVDPASDVTGNRLKIGTGHTLTGFLATIAGGSGNTANNDEATVGGGAGNTASGFYGSVGAAGLANTASGDYSRVGGGANNTASGLEGTVGGGYQNNAGVLATVGGGSQNIASGNHATVSGGATNIASGNYCVVGGGVSNNTVDVFATIGGGYHNTAGLGGTVGGGENNTARNDSAVGGGADNIAIGIEATVAGGNGNNAGSTYAAIGGGVNNSAQYQATVGGGNGNNANGDSSTVGGGSGNNANGNLSTVSGGGSNSATNTYATVAGGYFNFAGGQNSFAAGTLAKALHDGSFVWADFQNANFASTANNQVSFRCLGGVLFTSGSGAANNSVSWTPGSGAWSFTSDRNAKESFAPLDVQAILAKVAQLPLTEWNYKGYADRHVGPMAQDFHAAFPFNASDTMLNSADVAGVSLAAIQGLNQKLEQTVKEKDARITELERRLTALEATMQKMSGRTEAKR